jgi:hypothetical protein
MPAHPFLIEFHFDEARREPTILEVVVEMRSILSGVT